MDIGITSIGLAPRRKPAPTPADYPWEIAGAGSDVLFGATAGSDPDIIHIDVYEPLAYAGRYSISVAALSTGPVCLVLPEISGTFGLGNSLVCRSGLWVYDADVGVPTILRRWLRNGLPILDATNAAMTDGVYQQICHADGVTPIVVEERSVWGDQPVEGPPVESAATVPVMASPFPALKALGRTGWAYHDMTDLGGMYTWTDKASAVSAFNQKVRVFEDRSSNGLDAIASNTVNYPEVRLLDGALWMDGTTSVGGCRIPLSLDGANEATLCVAVRVRNQVSSRTYQSAISARSSSNPSTNIGYSFTNNNWWGRVRIGASLYGMPGVAAAKVPSASDPLTAVLTIRKTPTHVQGFLNGQQVSEDAITGTIVANLGIVELLNGQSGNEMTDGWVGPWFAARFALDDTQRSQLETYFMSIAGVSP